MSSQTNLWHAQSANAESNGLMRKLPALLRLLGATALLVAMLSFLAKGWQNGNDLFRYLLLLGHTGALAAIGLASGHWLKESKGARLLLTLALATVPANFAILGAFIFARVTAFDAGRYPAYVAWSVDSLSTALITSGAALLLLLPLTLLGFTVLARSMSKKLSLLFVCSNAALLLPLRDAQWVSLLLVALTVLVFAFSRRISHQHSSARTREGITALGLQLLPLLVLAGRSLWLYSVNLFLLAVLSGTLFVVLRQMSLYLEQTSKLRNLLDALSLIPALALTLWLSAALYDAMLLPQALVFPLAAFISAAMLYDISRRNQNNAAFYRRLAIVGLMLSLLANLSIFTGLLAALACIAAGLILLIQGYRAEQRSLFGGGVILLLAGVAQQLYQLLHHFDLGGLASLAVMGVAAIVAASMLESQGGRFRPRFEAWRSKFQKWQN